MIIGGSRCAAVLAVLLSKAGGNVKIVEKDLERSRQLAERLPNVTVLCADGSSQQVLRSENISKMDAVVTLTDMDEENIIISMYANSVGVPQAITKINRTEYNSVFQSCGIECMVSPKDLWRPGGNPLRPGHAEHERRERLVGALSGGRQGGGSGI